MNFNLIAQKLIDDGIAQIGFSNLEKHVPKRYRHLPMAITLIYSLSSAVLDEVNLLESPTFSYFHHYRTVNSFLDREALWLATMIERCGHKALPIGASQSVKDMGEYSGAFQHKTAAVHAGLGWIGKSALFVSPTYGPRVRLVTVLTDMPLPKNAFPPMKAHPMSCGTCRLCADKCPAMAITGENFIISQSTRSDIFDPKACSDYMKKAYKNIGRGAVCGLCMVCCPFGKKKE